MGTFREIRAQAIGRWRQLKIALIDGSVLLCVRRHKYRLWRGQKRNSKPNLRLVSVWRISLQSQLPAGFCEIHRFRCVVISFVTGALSADQKMSCPCGIIVSWVTVTLIAVVTSTQALPEGWRLSLFAGSSVMTWMFVFGSSVAARKG